LYPQMAIKEDGSTVYLIHFAFRWTDKDVWRIACAPQATPLCSAPQRPHPWFRSDDPRAVTCPFCQKTEQFKQAKQGVQNLFPRMRDLLEACR